ncbi:MAG: dihydroorotase [Clostridiales bacterium]|nr:dihydroorotase [Clostridiales bacterium]
MSTVIRGARLVDAHGVRAGNLLVSDGRIRTVGEGLQGDRTIDGAGLVLMPAFIDLHAHFRDPGLTHKEDIESGCRAALHGGYTFVNLMPNTQPVCSSMETVYYVREKASTLAICGVHQTVSITEGFDGKTLAHLEELDGDVRWLSDDGFGVENTDTILAAMRFAQKKGIGLMLHEEYRVLTPEDAYLSEGLPTFRDVQLALLTGCRTHFCHVSTAKALEYILEGKRQSGNITFEVSPHHIALNDTNPGKVAPPLRREEDRRALIAAVLAGQVDAIATDHAPHTEEDKSAGANGFTGLDLSFATCYTVLCKDAGLELSALSRLLSLRPAELMGLPPALLEPGLPANLVLVDVREPFIAKEGQIHSRSKNSPMLGRELYGKICMTMKEGQILYEAH